MIWAADSIHGVMFYAPSGDTPDALQPWLRLFGTPPQSFQSNQPGLPPGGMAMGQVGLYQFALAAQQGRQEIVVSPAPSGSGLPTPIREVDEALTILSSYFEKMLTVGTAVRIAVVVNLSRRFVTIEEAVAAFKNDTGIRDLPRNATDLQLALNVPRQFNAYPVGMNRLCRWGTSVQQLFSMQMAVGVSGPAVTIQEFPVETLQVDVSSSAQDGQLSASSAIVIAQELATEARMIMSQGYGRLVS